MNNVAHLFLGDCLEVLPLLPDASVDLVLADLPYGTTRCRWDVVIPFAPMRDQLRRVIKPEAAMVLFGTEPFSSHLRMSFLDGYKYDWVWNKRFAGNFVQAQRQPLKIHENIMVFCDSERQSRYFPQMTPRATPILSGGNRQTEAIPIARTSTSEAFGKTKKVYREKFPETILSFSKRDDPDYGVHPTQKPVKLLEYLIQTYALPGETVLDFVMGSGSTGVACQRTERRFIGIEKEEKYFNTAKKRIGV